MKGGSWLRDMQRDEHQTLVGPWDFNGGRGGPHNRPTSVNLF